MEKQKVALITGANSELGLPIVRAFLKLGYFVWGHYNSNAAAVAEFEGSNFRALRADLTEPPETKALYGEIAKVHDGIDLLVNMVGPFDQRPLAEVTPEAWDRLVSLNLNSVFNSVYHARPLLVSKRSQIINFTYAGVENIRARRNWRCVPAGPR